MPVEIVRTFRAFLKFCYFVQRDEVNEDILNKIDEALERFYHYRKVFRTSGVRPEGFNLPQQHATKHYRPHIELFGALNGLCSSITESKHIKAVKEPWRRSNRNQPLGQMLFTNQRLDKLAASRADFKRRGMLEGTCLSDALLALASLPPPALSAFGDSSEPELEVSQDDCDKSWDNSEGETERDREVLIRDEQRERDEGSLSEDEQREERDNGGAAPGPRVENEVLLARTRRAYFSLSVVLCSDVFLRPKSKDIHGCC